MQGPTPRIQRLIFAQMRRSWLNIICSVSVKTFLGKAALNLSKSHSPWDRGRVSQRMPQDLDRTKGQDKETVKEPSLHRPVI